MESTKFNGPIQAFLVALQSDPEVQGFVEQRQERIAKANQLFNLNHIPKLSRNELESFLRNTDAFTGVRGKTRLFRELIGENDEHLPKVRQTLSDLVQRAEIGLTAEDFIELKRQLPYIGPAFLSEILALRFPQRYWIWNGQVRRFIEEHGVDIKDEIPYGKKADEGVQYLTVKSHIDDLRRVISEIAGET